MTDIYFVNNLLFVGPCLLLLYLAFRDQIKRPRLPVVAAAAVLYLFITLIAGGIYLKTDTSVEKTVISAASQLVGVFIFSAASNYTFGQSLFIITVVKNYSENVRIFSYQIYFMATGRLPKEPVAAISYIMIGLSLCLFPLLCLLYKKLVRPALDYTRFLVIWRVIWVIPICNTLIYTLAVAPDAGNYARFPGGEFLALPLLWSLLTFATYGVLLRTIIAVSQNARFREKLSLTEMQIAAQQKQLELLQAHIQETRRARHDIRQHFLVLGNLAKNRDLDGVERYLEKAGVFSASRPTEVFCENMAVNALLGYYKDLAKKERIRVTMRISVFEKIPVMDTELCIVLGNLLENAVEACKRMKSSERFMDLEMAMQSESLLVILVRNSYEGLVRRAPDGTFFSAKERGRKGIGVSSVLNITEKYHGVSRFEYEGQVFCASLLLNGRKQ